MAIAFRRGNYLEADASAATIASTFSSVNAGDLLVVSACWDDPAGTITATVADSSANTWGTAAVKRSSGGLDSIQTFYCWGAKASSGADTVTITFSTSAVTRRIGLTEWRSTNGAWIADPLDQAAGASGNSSTPSSGSVTPTTDNELIYGWGQCNNDKVIVPSGGFSTVEPAAGGEECVAMSLIQTTKAAVAATATIGSAQQWVIQVATFKDVTGEAPPPPLTPPSAATTSVRFTRQGTPSSGRARALQAGAR